MSGDILKEIVAPVLFAQKLGVLATRGEEYPYTSLVGFAASKDLRSLVFATLKGTRKYKNLKTYPKVTLLVTSSTNSDEDFKDAASITALGDASDTEAPELDYLTGLYLEKFPFLKSFLEDPSCSLIRVAVERYIAVTRFREVKEIHV